MREITMCHGRHCDRRNDCYRHRAVPSGEYQSWLMLMPEEQGEHCRWFLDVQKDDYVRGPSLREPSGEEAGA